MGTCLLTLADWVNIEIQRPGRQFCKAPWRTKGMSAGEILHGEFRVFGAKLKGRTSRVVISGLPPVPCASEARTRKIIQFNLWLRSCCREREHKNFGSLGSLPGKICT